MDLVSAPISLQLIFNLREDEGGAGSGGASKGERGRAEWQMHGLLCMKFRFRGVLPYCWISLDFLGCLVYLHFFHLFMCYGSLWSGSIWPWND